MGHEPGRRLQHVAAEARRHAEHLRVENEKLQALVRSLQEEHRRLADEYVVIQEELNALAVLYAAADRMHAAADAAEIVAVIDDVTATLVGCEDVGVFELRPDPPGWRPLHVAGRSGWDGARLEQAAGIARAALMGGTAWFASAPGELPTAVLPLKVGRRVTGALALGRLLPQKEGRLTSVDRELLELLAQHAGPALRCAVLSGPAEPGR